MTNIQEKELKKVAGGAVGTYLLISGVVIFIISVIDGYVRPLKCN